MFYLLGIQFTERIQHNLKNVFFHERPGANWFWNQHISADNAVLFFAIRRNQAQLSAGKVNMQEFSSDEASSKNCVNRKYFSLLEGLNVAYPGWSIMKS